MAALHKLSPFKFTTVISPCNIIRLFALQKPRHVL